MESKTSLLPANHPQRELLHNEVHARPPARIRQPALLTYVAVFNEGVTRGCKIAYPPVIRRPSAVN